MTISATINIPEQLRGARLDKVLAQVLPAYSRSQLQRWLKDGYILVDGQQLAAKACVDGGECINLAAPKPEGEAVGAEAIDLDIIYADADIIIINKPAGLVMHPAAGNWSGTLQNALLHYDPKLQALPRAGIVHRLDKDTSGLLVVARNLAAHNNLVAALQAREVGREYLAICVGHAPAEQRIETNIGRHPSNRQKMAVRQVGGKVAITTVRRLENFRHHSLVNCKLQTGRTHQIRVHMSHLGLPLVGDQCYGGRARIGNDLDADLQVALAEFSRQALHAYRLSLLHPQTGKALKFVAAPPADFAALQAWLRADYSELASASADDAWDDWDESQYSVECVYEP